MASRPMKRLRCYHMTSPHVKWFSKITKNCGIDVREMEGKRACKAEICGKTKTKRTSINSLFPEILTIIFCYLDLRDKGRVAQVCRRWRDAAYAKCVWRSTQARLHFRRSTNYLFPSLAARGIRKIRVLSLKNDLSYLVHNMNNMECLNLKGCYNVTDISITKAFVKTMFTLTVLNLSLCKQVTDTSVDRICRFLCNLEVLDLGGCCNITNGALLYCAKGLVHLKNLNLRSCRHISDLGIAHIAGLTTATEGNKNLNQLCLQDCQKITDNALFNISKGLLNLEELNLSFCCGIRDVGLAHLSSLKHLKEINLRSCDNIGDEGISNLADGCSSLSSLDVSFCDRIGDDSLKHISHSLYNLKHLELGSCRITDEGLYAVARNLQDIRVLNIGQCNMITDRGLSYIADNLRNVTSIDLYGCTKVTKIGLNQIVQMPELRILNLGLWQR